MDPGSTVIRLCHRINAKLVTGLDRDFGSFGWISGFRAIIIERLIINIK